MKRLFYALVLLLIASPLMAAQQTILGGAGVLWGDEKTKINSNFSELYGKLAQALLTTSSPTFADLTLTSDLNLKDWIYFTSDDDTHYVAVAAGNNTANYILRWPTAAPGGSNYVLNFDADGTGGWTDPASLGGDDLGSAAASDIVTLFNSGTCSGYLKSDGTCDTPSGAAHDAVTLSTDLGNNLLGLSTQQITLDSQTANYFFAAPNGSAGVPSFRAMVDGDIPSAIARDSELPTASSLSVDDLITLSGVSTGAVNLGSFTGATIDDNLTVKAALQDVETSFEAKLPAGTDGQYGVWLNNNTTNPNTYSTGKWGYTVYNNAPYWCYNGTCTAIPSAGFANPMTTAGDMIKGGTSGAATRMVPGTGVVTALEATPNATGGVLTHGSAPLAGIIDSTTEALGAGSLEVGHASDTTIARSEAGVITVEGVVVPTTSSTSTLTNKTLDANGTGNVVKGYGYVTFTKPHNRGSATAAVGTTETDQLYGVPAFADDVETNNYVDYIAIVPPDWDSSVDPVATLKFRLGGSDTADHDYIVSMIDIADSTAAAGTPADAINLAYTADGSGASGDIETATATLTGWGSAASASAYWLIRVTRDGDDGTNDASTVDSYPMSLTIRYGFSQ